MTRIKNMAAALLAVALPMGAAHAAGTYDPSRILVDVTPGESVQVSYTYSDPGAFFVLPYFTYSGDPVLGSWIGETYKGTSRGSGVANITIDVPDYAPAGTYSGRFHGMSFGGAHGSSNSSVSVHVTVVSSTCGGLAEFVSGSENEIDLWAPNNTVREVELTGDLSVPDGCSIVSATWDVVDEYGEYSSHGDMEITGDDDGYVAKPLIEVSRKGRDEDKSGRTYTVTLNVETEDGVATQTRTLVIRHDRRDKAGDNPAGGRGN